MNSVLLLAPLAAAVIVVVALLVSIITLWVRYQHPLRIFLRTLGAGSMIAILGLAGILPDAAWWVPWLLTLATVGGAAFACRRLLVSHPPSEPTPRQARQLTTPHVVTVVVEVIIYLALVVVALAAG